MFISWLKEVLLNATITSALLVLGIFLFKNIVLQRIKKAISHEYDSKLEDLKLSNQKILEDVKSNQAEQESYRNMMLSLLSTANSSTQEKRISGIDLLWKEIQHLKSTIPYYISLLDIFNNDLNILKNIKNELDHADLLSVINPMLELSKKVNDYRPFLGDALFSLYQATYSIICMSITTTMSSYKEGNLKNWYEEKEITEYIKVVLSEEERTTFISLKKEKLNWIIRLLESKIIASIQNELAGQPAAELALRNAQKIIEASPLLDKTKFLQQT